MGLIDWPSPYASNVAIYKTDVTLPNGRGSTRRFSVPGVEVEALNLSDGDKVSVEMYDRGKDREVSFDTTLRTKSSQTARRFTMPLRKLDLEDDEFDAGRYYQVILRKTSLISKVPTISPKRIYDTAIFKRKPKQELNKEQRLDSTLHMTIPKSQSEPLSIETGDDLYVTLFRIPDDSDSITERIKGNLTSVNRSTFKASTFGTGRRSVTFSIPAKRRRMKGYSADDIFQVAVKKA